MDDKIDQMVAKHIKLPEIVIEGEGKIGEDANTLPVGIFDQIFNTIPCEYLDLNIWIVGDIGPIIKLEGNRKGIGVDNKSDSRNQSDRDEMSVKVERSFCFLGRGAESFFRKSESLFDLDM